MHFGVKVQGLRHEFEWGTKARKSIGPRPLTPFTAALKLLAAQKSGWGARDGPWPPRPPCGGGPEVSVILCLYKMTEEVIATRAV